MNKQKHEKRTKKAYEGKAEEEEVGTTKPPKVGAGCGADSMLAMGARAGAIGAGGERTTDREGGETVGKLKGAATAATEGAEKVGTDNVSEGGSKEAGKATAVLAAGAAEEVGVVTGAIAEEERGCVPRRRIRFANFSERVAMSRDETAGDTVAKELGVTVRGETAVESKRLQQTKEKCERRDEQNPMLRVADCESA